MRRKGGPCEQAQCQGVGVKDGGGRRRMIEDVPVTAKVAQPLLLTTKHLEFGLSFVFCQHRMDNNLNYSFHAHLYLCSKSSLVWDLLHFIRGT